MDDVKQLLDQASTHFTDHQETIKKINNDPVVRQWLALDFEAQASALSFFNINASTLVDAKNNYVDLGKIICNQFEHCENELGNLKTEFKHQTGNKNRILQQLNEMRVVCGNTQDLIRQFNEQAQVFRDADTTVRTDLTFKTMIPLARANAGNKAEIFNTGYELYTIATSDDNQPNRESRLNELHSKAKEIEGAIERLELPNLPGIALEIIRFHLEKATRAIQMIKNFVEEANRDLFHDIELIKAFKTEIEQCNQLDISAILQQSPALIQALSKAIIDLNYLSHILNQRRFFTEQLNDLKLLHRVLRLDILPDMVGRINTVNSMLNPTVFAGRKANHYFFGIPGLIRTLKLLLASLSGKKVVSDIELQNKIADAIRLCPLYFSNKPADLITIEQFVSSYLKGYAKPFPYNSLFAVIKNALAEYGDRAECFFDDYPINPERAATTADSASANEAAPANLKKLMKRIEKRLITEIKI